MATRKTGFDKFLDEKQRDPAFRAAYEAARAEIASTDALIRALDDARVNSGLSKSELARRMDVAPEVVRRLLTAKGANPTVDTVLKVAAALGYHLEFVPEIGTPSDPAARGRSAGGDQASTDRGPREKYSEPSRRTFS